MIEMCALKNKIYKLIGKKKVELFNLLISWYQESLS